MLPPRLASIDCWIFDLDNSLYPASANLFELIDVRMGEYIAKRLGCTAAEARIVQKGFFRDHGTTLAGLMKEHGVEPRDFLDYVHDIDFARLTADPRVVAAPPGAPRSARDRRLRHRRRSPKGRARPRRRTSAERFVRAWRSSRVLG